MPEPERRIRSHGSRWGPPKVHRAVWRDDQDFGRQLVPACRPERRIYGVETGLDDPVTCALCDPDLKGNTMVNFSAPATGGARIDWHSVKGNLLVLVPIDIKRDIPTKLGDPTDAIVADVHILDGDRAGDWEPGVWVFPKVLKAQLEPKVDATGAEMVLGRLGQEPTTKGSPAWKLADPTAADGEAAQRWHAWRLDQGLPITSVSKPVPVATPEPTAATSFSPKAGATLGEQVAASKANVAAASGTWPGAGAEPPF